MAPGRPTSPHPPPSAPHSWRERISALTNVPPLLAMVWATSPPLAAATVVLRFLSAFIPVAQLWVAKLIIDQVAHPRPDRDVWSLLLYEVGLVVLGDVLSRATGL